MDPKKIGRAILFLPIWLIILLDLISAAALILVFILSYDAHPIGYAAYALSFYALLVTVLFFSVTLPKNYRKIRDKALSVSLFKRFSEDAAFRTHVSLYISLSINIIYVIINVTSFIIFRSAWFVILAVYYVILALMRFLLARYTTEYGIGAGRRGEAKVSILASFILLTVNLVLSGAVLMILYTDRGFEYPGLLIYAVAAYTFYMTAHAVSSLVRYRHHKSPVILTSKIISLSAALVSMLSLETAMLSEFGADMPEGDRWWLIALTGAGVAAAVLAMSVFMIIKSFTELRKSKE